MARSVLLKMQEKDRCQDTHDQSESLRRSGGGGVMTAPVAGTEALRKSCPSERYPCAQRTIRWLLFAVPCGVLCSPLSSGFRLEQLSLGGGDDELKR